MRAAIERPLSVLLDEVRSSIDYYRNQPGSSPLVRIVVTGGGAQLPGLSERLSALVGVPVEQARPRELVALGDIGFSEEELPRLDPYLPAAVGLALGGAGVGTVINLLPRAKRSAVKDAADADRARRDRGRDRLRGAARRLHVPRTPERLARQVAARGRRGPGVDVAIEAGRAPTGARSSGSAHRAASRYLTLLSTDVAWQTMITRITADLPPGITFTSFNGQSTPPLPVAAVNPTPVTSATGASGASTETTTTPTTVAPPPPTISGAITFRGTRDRLSDAHAVDRLDEPSSADRQHLRHDRAIQGQRGLPQRADHVYGNGGSPTPAAQSHRLSTYVPKAGK